MIVDKTVCMHCGACVGTCPQNAMFLHETWIEFLENCNECAIAKVCPTQAFVRVPSDRPYLLKQQAQALLENKADDPAHPEARELMSKVLRR